jgi:hypothetical protein
MKKLFVIFLLVSLVPFTVGCNGLWDFDDDDDPVAMKTLTSKVTFPATAVSANGNIRGVLAYKDLKLEINNVTFEPSGAVYNDNGTPDDISDDTVEVTFSAVVPVNNIPNGSQTMKVTSGATTLVEATIDLGNDSPDSITIEVSGTVNSSGTFTPTSVSTTVTIGGTTSTPTSGTITSTPDTPATVPTFTVDSVKYGITPVTSSSTTAISVNTLNPTFRVNFSAAPDLDTATWEIYVKSATTGSDFTLKSTDYPTLFTTTPVGTAVDVKLAGATGKALLNNRTYMVQLKATGLKDVNGTLLDPVAAFYFKTAATTYPPTTLTDYTGENADVEVADPQVITLTFSGNVDQKPSGTVTLERYDTSARTGTPTTLTIDADTATYAFNNNVVTVTFNESFEAGKFYTVKNETGVWLDANGNQIEGVTSINFATAQ